MHHLVLGIDPTELGPGPLRARHRRRPQPLGRGDRAPPAPGRPHLHPALHRRPRRRRRRRRRALRGAEPVGRARARRRRRHQRRDPARQPRAACSPAPRPPAPPSRARRISSGQRAAPGAIERVEIDPVTKEPRFRIIGVDAWSDDPGFPADARVTGICGSGIIEAIAEMRAAGLVDASGLVGSAEQTGTRAHGRAGPHPRLPPARRHPRHPGRRPRHPARQVRPLRRRPPADGRARHRHRRPHRAGRRLRRPHLAASTR